MPGRVLHEGCAMSCGACGASITVPAPSNLILRVKGKSVLVKEDVFQLGPNFNCTAMQQRMPLCNAVVWTGASVSRHVKVPAGHVLLQEGDGGIVGLGSPGMVAMERSRVRVTADDTPLKD